MKHMLIVPLIMTEAYVGMRAALEQGGRGMELETHAGPRENVAHMYQAEHMLQVPQSPTETYVGVRVSLGRGGMDVALATDAGPRENVAHLY